MKDYTFPVKNIQVQCFDSRGNGSIRLDIKFKKELNLSTCLKKNRKILEAKLPAWVEHQGQCTIGYESPFGTTALLFNL